MAAYVLVNTNSSVGHDSIVEIYSSLAFQASTAENFILGNFSVVSLGVNVIEILLYWNILVIGAGS